MRKVFLSSAVLTGLSVAGCGSSGLPVQTGRLADTAIVEASGLARSGVQADRYWVINDNGHEPVLYAIDRSGESLGSVALTGVANVDWEDLDIAVIDDQPFLVVADIGDNEGLRSEVALHMTAEPDFMRAGERTSDTRTTSLTLRYPDGAHDAESLAIAGDSFYILTKRQLPPVLYRGSLRSTPGRTLELEKLGAIDSLPRPDVAERAAAPIIDVYAWQPTAMSFSRDQRHALILTTRHAYLYRRKARQTWYEALNSKPQVVSLQGVLAQAEAATFTQKAPDFLATTENQHGAIFEFQP